MDATVEEFIGRFWGKARSGWHPLAYHQADVAACALAIAEARPWMVSWIADQLGRANGWSEAAVLRMITIFAYAHDSGKYALGFQVQAEEAFRHCSVSSQAQAIIPARGELRHDSLGLFAWSCDHPTISNLSEAILGSLLSPEELEAWQPLASATFGHHGHPTPAYENSSSFLGCMLPNDIKAAADSCRAFRAIIGGFPTSVDPTGAATVSIPLAGLLQVADWMGSDQETFPYSPPQAALKKYWLRVLGLARENRNKLGLDPVLPAPWEGPSSVLGSFSPTPMQAAASKLKLSKPFLAILEDTMGSGKTEAALIMAARAMSEGIVHGIFVGMPTTATADGQAARQASIRHTLFIKERSPPSFTVAHGRSDPKFWPKDPDEAPLSGKWIADERRLRLLADVSVGTVDQALLSVMATEFAAVRRFALLGKILIIDEIHAYDDYTLRLIEDLVHEHAAMGGSAILLSATLTGETKLKLMTAFRKGSPGSHQGIDITSNPAVSYPALTILRSDGAEVLPIEKATTAPPNKAIKFIHSASEAEAAMLAAAKTGCAAWIRLTVDSCIETGMSLSSRYGDVTVLHSRMPESQRRQIESELLSRFGKGKVGEATCRRGGIVVATSVIASSLDLDFDLMVIDLRGMDELLQAIGRGRRHRRYADGRLLPPGSFDERPSTPMLILAPQTDVITNSKWLEEFFGWGGAKVAGNAACAWRSAQLLKERGHVCYGEERMLLEAAMSKETVPTPDLLSAADMEAEGGGIARRDLAKNTQRWALRASEGYIASVIPPKDDEMIETRLDEVGNIEVFLIEESNRPFRGSEEWSAGRIRIPKRKFVQGGLSKAKERASEAGLPRGSYAVPLDGRNDKAAHAGEIIKKMEINKKFGLIWQE